MLKELKESMDKELKEVKRMVSHQKSINKKIEMTKRNQIAIL